MQKYIKVTGIPTHNTMIFPAFGVKEVAKQSTTAPFTETQVIYMNADSQNDTIKITYASTTDAAQNVAMANFIKDLIVKVQSTNYTKPYLTVDASDFPQAVTDIDAPAS